MRSADSSSRRSGYQPERHDRDRSNDGELPDPVDHRGERERSEDRREGGPRRPFVSRRTLDPPPRDHEAENDESRDEQKADDSELSEGFEIERVRVAEEIREARMLRPPRLVGPGTAPDHRCRLELVDGRAPELPSTAPVSRKQVRA